MRLNSLLIAAALVAALSDCTPDRRESGRTQKAPTRELFIDATESSGIRFQHFNGRNGEFYYPEIIGSGVALLDYNNDGKLDILVLQGTPLGPGTSANAPTEPCTAHLYRNDLVVNSDGTHNLKFTDVTEASGLCSREIGRASCRERVYSSV